MTNDRPKDYRDSIWEPGVNSPLRKLRKEYFAAIPEVCIERPRLVTQYHVEEGLLGEDEITILQKAKAYRTVLKERDAIVRHTKVCKQNPDTRDLELHELEDTSPFAGSTTSKFKGVLIHPELVGLILWPELETVNIRPTNPFYLSKEDAQELNSSIYSRWLDDSILELTRERLGKDSLEIKLLQNLVFYLTSKPVCISHTIPDFSNAVKHGLQWMIEDARKKQKGSTGRMDEFYSAVIEVMNGIIEYAENLSKEADRLAGKESNPQKKSELRTIADVYKRVPKHGATTFREGLTTVWLIWTALHLENPNVGLSLGRLDKLLYPLYQSDLNKLSKKTEKEQYRDQATELVCYLWLKIGDHVPIMTETAEELFGGTGSNQAITIGGVDEQGNDAVNELTYVILDATEFMALRDPNLNARYHPEKNTAEYLRRLCEVNLNTGATPAIHNDRAVIKAMISKGDKPEHARDYGIVGCVEPVSNGRHYGHNAAILLNLPAALELTLYNGCHRHTGLGQVISVETGDPTTFKSFQEFKDAFETQANWLIKRATDLNCELGKTHQAYYPTPILSAFFEGPMDKGKDVIQGGATINSSGAAIIGLSDVADSLSAIQTVIFPSNGKKKYSFEELLEAMDCDFDGSPEIRALHQRLLNSPKYGNENPVPYTGRTWPPDENIKWLVELLDKAFGEKTNYRGGKYRVGYWTMTIHAAFGRLTKALPNGRKASHNFSSGMTPVSGATHYLTEALNSAAKLPAACMSSGVALNLKYTPEQGVDQRDRNEMLKNFAATVKGFFDNRDWDGTENEALSVDGGMEVQFNITSRDLFEYVASHPHEISDYSDLLVRVSGYTAYFKDLNPQMQQEVIERSEYVLSTGMAKPFVPYVPAHPATGNGLPFSLDSFLSVLEKGSNFITETVLKNLADHLKEILADNMLESLLAAMQLAFKLSKRGLFKNYLDGYWDHIKDFEATYLFEARDGAEAAVVFKQERMEIKKDGSDEWDLRVVFDTDDDLVRFLMKGAKVNIMELVLGNKVEAFGNLNYLFKFAHMSRDLAKRFGLPVVSRES
jgi:pyruvate-formate lyase